MIGCPNNGVGTRVGSLQKLQRTRWLIYQRVVLWHGSESCSEATSVAE